MQYDKTQLAKDDTVTASVGIRNNTPATLGMVVVDLGIPPGFTADAGAFAELVDGKKIDKYRMTDRQIIVYLEKMTPSQTVTFTYPLKARFPIKAKTPAAAVYDYYNPTRRGTAPGKTVEVIQR